MKIVVLGDIHGNLPALETCYEQAEKEGYDWIAHTGDVVGYGPFPTECVDFLYRRNIPGARGNFDENVGADGEESGAASASGEDPEERDLAESSFGWTRRSIGLWQKRWLSDLPFAVRHQAGRRRVVVFHATPLDNHSYIGENAPESSLASYGDAASADIVALGHVHRPFHRKVERLHFINAGSVGRPRDGDPRTGYAVIETNGDVQVAFRRFEYDVERTARAIEDRGLPRALAERLRSGS